MSSEIRTLIDEYLESHARLSTPVAVFAEAHETGSEARIATARAQLIPLSTPRPGEQYAFEVNLDACTGCKACVAACHSLNGLDLGETWRDVGIILGGCDSAPYQQTVTSACHHCADPGCLNGCPVLAYEKDPVTGIVRHLDDQCIGCQYCVLKCPYDVPKYNDRLGIVRKCDMCHQRLSVGEAPACAQACPTHAIRIVTVPVGVDASGRPSCPTDDFLAAAPSPALTRPSTRYVSKNPVPGNARPGDLASPRPQHLHGPLVLMLALTQAGYGLLLGEALPPSEDSAVWLRPAALALIAAGLACSAAHLGQPTRMWRVFLNLRRSWLSREAVILGLSFGLLLGALAAGLLPGLLPSLPGNLSTLLASAAAPLHLAGLATGLAGVFCSAMIYIDTGRHHWRAAPVLARMGGTVLVFTGLALHPVACGLLLLGKLLAESLVLRGLSQPAGRTSASARLITGALKPLAITRLILGLLVLAAGLLQAPALVLLLPLLLGELAERALFFRAVDSSAMPSTPAPADLHAEPHG